MDFKYFSFFGDIVSIEELSQTSIEEFGFAKPDFRIRTSIKNHIELFGQNLNIGHNPYEWETSIDENEKKGKLVQTTFSRLPEEKWKYLILCHNHPSDNRIIPLTLALSQSDLTVLLQGNIDPNASSVKGYMNQYSGLSACIYYHDIPALNNQHKRLTDSDIEEYIHLKKLLEAFEPRKEEFPELDKALTDFLELRYISIFSPFKILGFVTVMELLLSNYDPANDTNSRISEQIPSKVDILNQESSNPIDIRDYFKGPDTLNMRNVMGKIYSYRNDIAHGKFSDFEDDLQILKHKRNEIIRFLNDVLKTILIRSIEDPSRINELKNQ